MIETDGDRAIFFDTVGGAAIAATYLPIVGAPLSVAIVKLSPDKSIDLGALGASAPTLMALIRRSDMPAAGYRSGDRLTIGATTHGIQGARADDSGDVVELELMP